MAESNTLQIFERDTTITPRKLREIGYIPGTIYGKDVEPINIQLKAHDFELALAHGQRKFTLEGLGKQYNVEVAQLQKMSTKEHVLHVEFVVPSPNSSKAKKANKAANQTAKTQKPAEQPAVEETPAEAPEPATVH